MGKNKCKCECCCCNSIGYSEAVEMIDRVRHHKALMASIAVPDDVFDAYKNGLMEKHRYSSSNIPIENLMRNGTPVVRASECSAWKARNGFTR